MCDDSFNSDSANNACLSLGSKTPSSTFQDGFYTPTTNDWSKENEIPILMDDVICTASDTDFFLCPHSSGEENVNGQCSHTENILLTCPDIL